MQIMDVPSVRRLPGALRLSFSWPHSCLPEAAQAAGAKDDLKLKFDVYVSNLRVFKVSIGMNVDDTDYTANISMKSKGLVSLFAKTKSNMSVKGKSPWQDVPALSVQLEPEKEQP